MIWGACERLLDVRPYFRLPLQPAPCIESDLAPSPKSGFARLLDVRHCSSYPYLSNILARPILRQYCFARHSLTLFQPDQRLCRFSRVRLGLVLERSRISASQTGPDRWLSAPREEYSKNHNRVKRV